MPVWLDPITLHSMQVIDKQIVCSKITYDSAEFFSSLYFDRISAASKQPSCPDDAQQFYSGAHSKVEPLLPIPNRTVKRLRADDIADCP